MGQRSLQTILAAFIREGKEANEENAEKHVKGRAAVSCKLSWDYVQLIQAPRFAP